MNSLRRILICAILLSAIVAVYSAEEPQNKTEQSRQLAVGGPDELGRRKRHRFGHFGHLWLGGIHAVSALVAIKFKLVLIFLAVVGTIFYGYKLYAGSSCISPIYGGESSGPILPFEGYSNSISGAYSSTYPGSYSSSYPGADPYSAYSADHGISAGPPTGADVAVDPSSSPYASSGPYRRISTQKRSFEGRASSANETPTLGFDFGELAFTLLGVESQACRRRFVCEMSVNYRRNPILGSAYSMISRQFFPNIVQEVDSQAPKSLKQCAQLYSECRGPQDPIPEDNNNAIDESGSSTTGANQVDQEGDQSRSSKPRLDQVQRFVVGSSSSSSKKSQ